MKVLIISTIISIILIIECKRIQNKTYGEVLDKYLSTPNNNNNKNKNKENPDCDCLGRNLSLLQPSKFDGPLSSYLQSDTKEDPCECDGEGVMSVGTKESIVDGGSDFKANARKSICVISCGVHLSNCMSCCDGSVVYNECKIDNGSQGCVGDCNKNSYTCEDKC
eukprot:GHVR01123462.1.p1 GENE.GHVR01123462.1~~GHVR01123462.1.p1  ORF type:complete len:165 (+),score=39.34 GHVR01123462.1:382-876(+)